MGQAKRLALYRRWFSRAVYAEAFCVRRKWGSVSRPVVWLRDALFARKMDLLYVLHGGAGTFRDPGWSKKRDKH